LPGEVGGSVAVKVVGTIGDLSRARAEVSAVYRGNVCVYRVRYSSAHLRRIVDRLRLAPGLSATVDPIHNRVRVVATVLDPQTNTVLDEVGREALIVDEPLMRWLD